MTLRGAYTALVTPFTADGSAVDIDLLADNIRETMWSIRMDGRDLVFRSG